jgi:hypothetical protein
MPLVALDQSWAFCLPKKTGSQSLAGMLAPGCMGGDWPIYAKIEGEFHGCEWDGAGKRYMVVRNPQERLASMYWWSTREGNFNAGPGGPDAWLARYAELLSANKPHDAEWLPTQGKMAQRFKPDRAFRLEDGLQAVLDHLGVTVPHIQRRNETRDKRSDRKPFDQTFTVIPGRIRQWLDSDAGGWY